MFTVDDLFNVYKPNTKKYKLIFSDIDGTLTNYHGVMDETGTIQSSKKSIDIDAVQFLRKLPIEVILISGRPIDPVFFLSKDLGLSKKYSVGENGGVVRVLKDGVIKDHLLGNKNNCRVALKFLRDNGINIEIEFDKTRVTDFVIKKPLDILKAKTLLNGKFKDKFSLTDSGSPHYHLHESICNKGNALRYICDLENVLPENTIAFSNADNDIDLLRTAGIGIAVNNSTPNLKKIADYVTKKPYGKGVIEGLLKYVLK